MKKETKTTKEKKVKVVTPSAIIKLDLGCGPNKKDASFTGVDSLQFYDDEGKNPKVDVVHDLTKPWPWKDGTVDEIHCSHFVEHLTASQRIFFANEVYRVLKKGEFEGGKPSKGFCTIITPHWSSQRAYGDMTHQWPPVSEFWYYYLSKDWRKTNAPHNSGYECDFGFSAFYGVRQDLLTRNQEYQQYALMNFKEAASDLIAQIVKM